MNPQCSCVVYSGILLTWDPLVGFEERGARVGGKGVRLLEVGIENRQQHC